MGIRHMSGSPWHLEKYTREEGDDRRHKHRCIHYRISDNHCCYYNERCRGSAHCTKYIESVPSDKPSDATTTDVTSQCSYYNKYKNQCRYYETVCSGSALCDRFKLDRTNTQTPNGNGLNKQDTPKNTQHYFKIGDRVKHHNWGKGTIIDLDDDLIVVSFDNGNVKNLGETYCLKNHLIYIL